MAQIRNPRFPHLLPEDAQVWQRWLDKRATPNDIIEYDVPVGTGRPRPDLPTPELRQMALKLSQRRIDAVVTNGPNRLLVEITRQAGLKAIGQLTAYPILYRQTYPGNYNLGILLVCEELQSDIQPALEEAGIPWEIV